MPRVILLSPFEIDSFNMFEFVTYTFTENPFKTPSDHTDTAPRSPLASYPDFSRSPRSYDIIIIRWDLRGCGYNSSHGRLQVNI